MSKRDQRIADLETSIEANETRISDNSDKIDTQETKVNELSETARDALARAEEAGKIAKGQLVYQMALSDDICHFGIGEWKVSGDCARAIEEFALKLINDYPHSYLEIQGHTDALGDEEYNYELGLKRAEAVRRYLNDVGKIALRQMSVISYGETKPISDNSTAEGRRQNRRVEILVLE